MAKRPFKDLTKLALLATSLLLSSAISYAQQTPVNATSASLTEQRTKLEEQLAKDKAAETKAQAALDQARAALANSERMDDREAAAVAREAVQIAERALSKARALRQQDEEKLNTIQKTLVALKTKEAPEYPSPVLLSKDPDLAMRVKRRLDEVNGRIARLKKAIEILGNENPEWEREWARVTDDMKENSDRLLWVSLDMLTLDLAEAYKYAKELDAAAVGAVFGDNAWAEIARQKDKLQRLRQTWVGSAGGSLDKWIGELDQLEKAAEGKNVAECVRILRDAIAESSNIYRHAKEAIETKDGWATLYGASITMGEISTVFVQGVGARVTPAARFVARGIETGLLLKLLREDEKQFRELSERSFDRHQKKLELLRRVTDLDEERSRLEWALQKASSNDD